MKSKATYENEVEKPSVPSSGSMPSGMGCADFKGEAMDQAYGQSGDAGCKSDDRKISSQMKSYGWTDESSSGH